MALVKRTLPGLYGGVSQQPSSERLENQQELQKNLLGTIVEGLKDRPPGVVCHTFTAKGYASSKFHVVERDESERYVFHLYDDGTDMPKIDVYQLDYDGTVLTSKTYSEQPIGTPKHYYTVTSSGLATDTVSYNPTTQRAESDYFRYGTLVYHVGTASYYKYIGEKELEVSGSDTHTLTFADSPSASQVESLFLSGPTLNTDYWVLVSDIHDWYLAGASLDEIDFLSVEDYTFVLNRRQKVAMDQEDYPTGNLNANESALIWIKKGQASTSYTVDLSILNYAYQSDELSEDTYSGNLEQANASGGSTWTNLYGGYYSSHNYVFLDQDPGNATILAFEEGDSLTIDGTLYKVRAGSPATFNETYCYVDDEDGDAITTNLSATLDAAHPYELRESSLRVDGQTLTFDGDTITWQVDRTRAEAVSQINSQATGDVSAEVIGERVVMYAPYPLTIGGTSEGSFNFTSTTTTTCTDKTYTETTTTTASTYATNAIASALATTMDGDPSTLSATAHGSVIHLQGDRQSYFCDISTEDGEGDQNMVIIWNQVQKFTDLPKDGVVDGFLVKVVGEDDNDGYYVKWDDTNKVWVETVGERIPQSFHPWTMPHVVVRNSDGTFTFGQAGYSQTDNVWANRLVGDEDTNPYPSFVNQKINRISLWRGRLTFISGEDVNLSRSTSLFNWFGESSKQVLDTDPISVKPLTKEFSKIEYVLPFRRELLLMTSKSQFILDSGEEALKPATARIRQSSLYRMDSSVEPAQKGNTLFFSQSRGAYSRMMEYYVDRDSSEDLAYDLNGHVPRYVPSSIDWVIASDDEDLVFVKSTAESNKLYVYQYRWEGKEKVQSAWSEWDLGVSVEQGFWYNSRLYLFVKDASWDSTDAQLLTYDFVQSEDDLLEQLVTYRKTLGSYPDWVDQSYVPRLDHLSMKDVAVPGDWSSWSVTIPGEFDSLTVIDPSNGRRLIPDSVTPGSSQTVIAFSQNLGKASTFLLLFGVPYERRVDLSKWYLRNSDGTPKIDGRLQIQKVLMDFYETGAYTFEVEQDDVTTMTRVWEGYQAGISLVGVPTVRSFLEHFIVMGNNTNTQVRLKSSSHLPMQVRNVTWEGDLTNGFNL